MRKELLINNDWTFYYFDEEDVQLHLPHTWNNIDGQDGGNDYRRGTCVYKKSFTAPEHASDERVYIDFAGVNASARVLLNEQL